MRVTIKILNKGEKKVVLFGARENYLRCNFGNPTSLEFCSIEFDDDYKKEIGMPLDYEEDVWSRFSAFMLDCIKYKFEVISINGTILQKHIHGTYPMQYEPMTENLNPFVQRYEHPINGNGEHTIEIVLIKKEN